MTNWYTAHRRRQNKQSRFTAAAMLRLEIANRYAVTREAKTILTTRLNVHGYRMSYQAYFYALKDAILARYGSPSGYALQSWRSGWDDWDTGYDPEACLHQHVLRCVRLRGRIFHVPTGAFDFANFTNDYGRSGGNFDFYRTLCTAKIEGKKTVSNPPSLTQAKAALLWLERRFGRLPQPERRPPHTINGTWEHAALIAYNAQQHAEALCQREAWEAEMMRRRNAPKLCRWCQQTKKELDFTKRADGICNTCAPIAAGCMPEEVEEEIPF